MDVIANQRYQSIKQQLDNLHYSQPFNIESSALVERLLTDLLKTTEAFQKTKTELALITSENKLNQQALQPLAKENERLQRENNQLHFQVIQAKEQLDQVELRWKGAVRQLTGEVQDMKFLVDQKDIKIRKLDAELTKMRSKYEKVLSKMYMTDQDEVLPGLAPKIQDRGEVNSIMNSHKQDFQMSSTLQKQNPDVSDIIGGGATQDNQDQFRTNQSAVSPYLTQNQDTQASNKKWAEELTKADDRASHFQQQYLLENKKRREVEETLTTFEKQLSTRDEEIKRLHNLYEGGQNLEKLNVRFVHENNAKTIAKLENQLDFLNKENHRLQQQLDFIRGGRSTLDELDNLKQQLKDLQFENDQLRGDLKQSVKLIKDQQEKELESQRGLRIVEAREEEVRGEVQQKLKELLIEHEKLKHEYQRVQSVKDRISELEAEVKKRDERIINLEQQADRLEQQQAQLKNEVNFLNGKCSTLKRDLEYQERYVEKYKDENAKLIDEVELLKLQQDQQDRESQLLRKQVNGLQDDNDRINRMYQVVEREAFSQGPLSHALDRRSGLPRLDGGSVADSLENSVEKGRQQLGDIQLMSSRQEQHQNEMQKRAFTSHSNESNRHLHTPASKHSQQPAKHFQSHQPPAQHATPKGMPAEGKAAQNQKWKVVEDDFGSVHGSVHGSAKASRFPVDENMITQKRY